jgi:hypothetical protein
MAVTMKAALDALLAQLAGDPDIDLEAYGGELVALFERATRAHPDGARRHVTSSGSTDRTGEGMTRRSQRYAGHVPGSCSVAR